MIYTGTSGFSYKEWKGHFYPEDLAAARMLEYYASRLSTVEINNTFYRMPKKAVVEGWAGETPENFRFVVKANQRITHRKRLREAGDELAYLLEQLEPMRSRLGALLFQLPPNFKKDVERLKVFLELLPEGLRAAFEFRHDAWYDEDVYAALGSRNCALVSADTEEDDTPDVHATADWGYLRLRRSSYDDAQLEAWEARLRDQTWTDTFVFFKHEDAGVGPALAEAFARRLEA